MVTFFYFPLMVKAVSCSSGLDVYVKHKPPKVNMR